MRTLLVAAILAASACDSRSESPTAAVAPVEVETRGPLVEPDPKEQQSNPATDQFPLSITEIEPDPDRNRLFVTYRNGGGTSISDATIVCRLLDSADDVIAEGRSPAEPIGANAISSPNLIRLSGDFDRVDVRTRVRCRVAHHGQESVWRTQMTYR